MEQRVVVFIVLSLLIIFGWNHLLDRMGFLPPPLEVEETERGKVSETREDRTRALSQSSTDFAFEEPASLRADADEGPLADIAMEELVTVETDLYRAELSNRGAVITSWELKRYTNETPEGPVPVQLMYQEGQFKGPLAVVTADEDLTQRIAEGVYRIERDFSRLDERRPVGHLTFTYHDPRADVLVEKRLTFHYDSYLVDVEVRTEGFLSSLEVGLGTNFGIVEWGQRIIGDLGPASLIDGALNKETPDKQETREGVVTWMALQDKYFISVIIPRDATSVVVRNEIQVVKEESEKVVSAGVRFAKPGVASFQLFAGPKQYDTLKALDIGLEDTIDFGWFAFGSFEIVRALAKPLFYVLRYFYQYTHNYGLAIILLTVCIKVFFVPLQYKSYKSMKDMQVIQPKVQEMQKKYKDDREKMNKELMKLYKDYKVNPVGGCLPMLLQMPVFIALFNILFMTVDLRQAPFALWITDLSMPDPFFVLPILMGASMVLQQKIMPTAMDPTQAKMMLLLPIFLTFIFLNFASGLVLYWLTNNVLTIAQQFITDRYVFKRPLLSSLTGAGLGGASDAKATASDGDAAKKREGRDAGVADSQEEPSAASVRASRQRGGGGGKKKKGKGALASKRDAGGESAAVSGRDGDEGSAASGDGAEGDGSMTTSTIVEEKSGTDSDGHGDPPGDSGGSKTVGSSEADRAGQS